MKKILWARWIEVVYALFLAAFTLLACTTAFSFDVADYADPATISLFLLLISAAWALRLAVERASFKANSQEDTERENVHGD